MGSFLIACMEVRYSPFCYLLLLVATILLGVVYINIFHRMFVVC